MKILILSVLGIIIACSSGQTSTQSVNIHKDSIVCDFNENVMGYDNPESLGKSFFKSLESLQPEDLSKYFVTQNVMLYIVKNGGEKNKEEGLEAVKNRWNEFESEKINNIKILLDNLKNHKIDFNSCKLDSIIYRIEDMPGWNGKLKSSTALIYFSYNKNQYSISLGDCGCIKNKWFIMTPYVKWE